MSVDATNVNEEILEGEAMTVAHAPIWGAAMLAGSIFQGWNSATASGRAAVFPATHQTVCWVAPKVVEVERQIARLKTARDFARASVDDADMEGIASSIALLSNLASGPIPVPVAGWSCESGPSLFFQSESFYGDLEISGKEVDYFLKWKDDAGDQEVFDREEVVNNQTPPKLLSHLFRVFARHRADVL